MRPVAAAAVTGSARPRTKASLPRLTNVRPEKSPTERLDAISVKTAAKLNPRALDAPSAKPSSGSPSRHKVGLKNAAAMTGTHISTSPMAGTATAASSALAPARG
jgi:hypothetical protein